MRVRSRNRTTIGCALFALAILALATACGGIAGQATLTPTPQPTASLPSSPTVLPSEAPTATEIPTTAGGGTPTLLPTESAAGLVVVTQQLAGQPTLDPLSFTTVQGQVLSHEDMVIGEPFSYQWLDDQPGMWAMVGEDRLVASEHYSEDGSQGWVTVTRGDEEIYRIETGMANPMPGLQGFFAYDGHWVLETNFYTDNDPFTGKITVDGVLLNDQEGYDKAFNAQTIAGKLFYLFQREGRIDAWYGGQVVALGYDDVPHYACCSGAEMNPYKGLNAVSFFGVRSGTWYFVQMGTPATFTP